MHAKHLSGQSSSDKHTKSADAAWCDELATTLLGPNLDRLAGASDKRETTFGEVIVDWLLTFPCKPVKGKLGVANLPALSGQCPVCGLDWWVVGLCKGGTWASEGEVARRLLGAVWLTFPRRRVWKLEGGTEFGGLEDWRCGAGARISPPVWTSRAIEDLVVLMRGGLAETPEEVPDLL
jgi:hypothetical protein